MSDDKQFEQLFYQYLQDAKVNSERDSAEQNLIGSFRTFITHAFGIKDGDMTQEQRLEMLHLKRVGRTDLLFGNLIFEFKRAKNLLDKKFHPMWVNQLKNYMLQSQADDKQSYIGLLTDGVRFEAYRLIETEIEQFDAFNLADLEPISAYIHLDAYLYTQTLRPPSPEDVVRRFGSKSPTFNEMQKTLSRLLARVRQSPKLDTWRVQWARLLSKVYGSDITTDELFIRHTYLAQFARLIGYASLLNRQSDMPNRYEDLEVILNGTAFEQFGIGNISENDFYSWILLPEIRDEALPAFFTLINHLIVYNLKQIDQDLLKQLYQNLVDPSTRHDLGEYYTPDWLAELTLREIDYNAPQSLYDPACGSGTFLFTAIKRLIQLGLHGEELVKFCMNNVMGTDVHPLAVTIARVNYLLAMVQDMRSIKTVTETYMVNIPIYMADALIKPIQGTPDDAIALSVNGERDSQEVFFIPQEITDNPQRFTMLVDWLEYFAKQAEKGDIAATITSFEYLLDETYHLSKNTANLWRKNLELLIKLKADNRNGIWAYILKNLMRPAMFAQSKFDVVVGNPPWLSYRYISSGVYQDDVKLLSHHYNLIGTKDVKLFTQMDLSTLFFMMARDRYLKAGGTIAFVMPRAVITGAKQHRPFQQIGFSRVLDMEKVSPLFNVPTCVLIQSGEKHTENVPSTAYKGKLPKHEMDLDEVQPFITSQSTTINFVDSTIRSEHYHPRFLNGATLVPRTLCFVKPQNLAISPAMMTDPDVFADAKAPYNKVRLKGSIERNYIYATLLSKRLYPFGYQKLHLVALPLDWRDNRLTFMTNIDMMRQAHYAIDWFEEASNKWDELKKNVSGMKFFEQLNYRNKIITQNPKSPYKVIYNASGTNIASCVLELASFDGFVYDRITNGFIVDHKTYYYDTDSRDEAHYLCAILNAPCVNEAIKAYQSQGLFGERDIHRTPFEACAIPPFDLQNPDHLELARLSKEAHEATLFIRTAEDVKGGIAGLRRLARDSAQKQIDAIDKITERILDL